MVIYGLHCFLKQLFSFEAKYFNADGVRYEEEYQGNEGGQKSNIIDD